MTRHTRRLIAPIMLCAAALAVLAGADTGKNTAASNIALGEATKAKRLEDPAPVFVGGVLEDELEVSCTLTAMQGPKTRKGVKANVQAVLFDANTFNEIQSFANQKGRTRKDGTTSFSYSIPRQGNFAQLVALGAQVDIFGGKKVTDVSFSCTMVDETP